MRFIITVSILLLLLSCTKEENIESTKTDAFTYKEQTFEIIPLYEEYLEYVDLAEEREEDLDNIYRESVIEPFWLKAFDEEYSDLGIDYWEFTTPTPINKVEKSVELLIQKQDTINERIKESLKDSVDKLPGGSKTIFIIPINPKFEKYMESLNGIAAFTWSRDVILVLIAPSMFDENYLKYVISHEYHHSVFLENNQLGTTLLDNIILEGKAIAFSNLVYPNFEAEWADFTSKEEERQTWLYLNENEKSTDIKHITFLEEGNKHEGIPTNANYKMGNIILESFLRENRHLSIEEWTNMRASEILDRSNYGEN